MKKYFIIAAAALVAMCACTKNEINTLPDQEINFQVANYMAQTKAGEVAFTGDCFGVSAWYTSGNKEDDTDQEFMVNEIVKPNLPGWKVDGKTYFWPKTGDIDFFAYAPAVSGTAPWAVRDVKAGKLNGSILSVTGTEDYMYSSMAMNYSRNAPEYKVSYGPDGETKVSDGVPVLFHHALSKVTVKFLADPLEMKDEAGTTVATWEVFVNEANFTNVVTGGTLEMALPSASGTGVVDWTLPENNIWTPAKIKSDLVAIGKGQQLTNEATAYVLGADEEGLGWTVLPQALENIEFHISYTIKAYNGGEEPYSVETIEVSLPISGEGSLFSPDFNYWEMNKRYVYTVTISPSTSEIYFDPAVEPWAAPVEASQTFPIAE